MADPEIIARLKAQQAQQAQPSALPGPGLGGSNGPVAPPPALAPQPKAAPTPAPETTPAPKPPAPEAPRAIDPSTMKMQPPKLELTPPPTPQHTSPEAVWGSMAMMFAAIGGLLTRTPATTALNAAAAVINGFHTGDLEATKEAYNTWRISSDNMDKMINFQNNAYKELLGEKHQQQALALGQERVNASEKLAQLKAASAANKDPAMAYAVQQDAASGDNTFSHARALQKSREDAKTKLDEAKLQMNKNYAANVAYHDWAQAHPEASDIDKLNEHAKLSAEFGSTHRLSYQPLSLEAQASYAKGIAKYAMDLPSSTVRARQPGWDAVFNEVKKENPNWSEANYKAYNNMIADLSGSKPGAKALGALTTVRQHLNFLRALAEKLPTTTDSQTANAVTASLARQFGETAVTNFDTASQIVGGEIVKAIQGAGGGIGGQGERDEVRKIFSAAKTPGQLQGAVNQVIGLIGGQLTGLRSRYAKLPKELLDSYFTPDIMSYYGVAGHDAAPAAQGASHPPAQTAAVPKDAVAKRVVNGVTLYKLKDGSIVNADGTPYAPAEAQ